MKRRTRAAERKKAVAPAPSLFDAQRARELADEGIVKAAERVPESVSDAAYAALEVLASSTLTFTADDFWRELERYLVAIGEPLPRGRDWSGAVFQRAYRARLIQRTGSYVKSERPEAHLKELPVLTSGMREIHQCSACQGVGRMIGPFNPPNYLDESAIAAVCGPDQNETRY